MEVDVADELIADEVAFAAGLGAPLIGIVATCRPESPGFAANLRLLARHGLSFDLCVRQSQLPIAQSLARACPDLQFVLDHCGNPEILNGDLAAWRTSMKSIADLPNVVWGSDWPVCTLAAPLGRWVDATRALLSGASADETARLFGRNAERVYRIG